MGFEPFDVGFEKQVFGKRLEQALVHIGFTRKELAGRLAVDRSLIGKWIRGERHPSVENLKSLVKLLVVEKGALPQQDAVEWVRSVREEITWNTVTGWCEGQVQLGLPPELGYWVMRPSYMQLRRQMLALGNQADTVQAVVGPPGIGKTTLLKALVHDTAVQQHYDLIVTVEAGPKRSLADVLQAIATGLGQSLPADTDEQTLLLQLGPVLGRQRGLVIVDDVWTAETMRVRDLGSDHCRILLATRQEDLLGVQHARRARIEVRAMEQQEGLALFQRYLGPDWHEEMQDSACQAVNYLGGIPHAIVLVAAQVVADGWEQWLTWLSTADKRFSSLRLPGETNRHTSLEYSFALSFSALDDAHQKVLRLACNYSNPIPLEEVARELGRDENTVYYQFKLLALRHLVEIDAGVIQLSPLVRDFGRKIHKRLS